MKKLQNNFTTPEQSKRLLELGVPADSADCYFFKDGNKYNGVPRPFFLFPRTYEYVEEFNAAYEDKIFPCWSVGRLMEIYDICFPDNGDWPNTQKWSICAPKYNVLKYVIDCIEEAVETEDIDFSKLED